MKMLYEGKAKQVFLTDKEGEYIVHFKDDATAFNGVKKEKITGKGELNNAISSLIFEMLEKEGIKTHFIKKINSNDMLVKKVNILPLEVIIRNLSAGSLSKRLGLEEGIEFEEPVFELCYKRDDLADPIINDDHAVILGLASRVEIEQIKKETLKINELLKTFFRKANLRLIDFKIEYGRTDDGELLLADEVSPDTCRLWDIHTNEKMDKDRFRRDLGSVIEAYQEVLERIK
ncbi:phosphoribosylaminoimidazole-succinocarboxamide synthase [Acetoanaerobium pronyense]|uniref:Phosphoribosylaminoimidazole-succinocarboxamide synthase n=1 Tax=Acetoanaerobium pronyense TaxID=1482736 RepID=A0ABS4KIZ3_9FIRM|nr:phosphoribosylaminoimidazolesuccinocarboxamide synthase [Acetoanaerobium pronyense]MBP2027106.1 phosphoribosylaminoimidazole-succinocarboxamide synthase [Acetoanaerobium pronyense]